MAQPNGIQDGTQDGTQDATTIVKDQIASDVLAQADEHDIDVDAIIQDKLGRYDGYQASTIANFAINDIENQIEAESAQQVKGLIMGTRDQYGRNSPRRITLIRSDGEHLEASTFSGTLPGPGGDQMPIPDKPVAATLRVSWNDEFENYDAKGIESVTELPQDEILGGLDDLAVRPSDIGPGDQYDVFVVRGKIAFVDPQTLFEDGEPAGDGPVLMRDERTGEDGQGEPQYHFEVSLEDDGNNRVRGHFSRQAYGRRYVDVPDLDRGVWDAYQNFDEPEAQTDFIQNVLRGREVLMIGTVTSFNQRSTDDGVMNYIGLDISALISADGVGQQRLDDIEESEDDEPEEETEEEPEPEPAEAEEESEPEEADGFSSDVIEDAKTDIENYCTLTETDVNTVSIEEVKEKVKGIDAPDPALRQALKQLQDDDATTETGHPDSAGGVAPFSPSDLTVSEIKTECAKIDDTSVLKSLLEAEENGENRKTAKEGIQNRLDYLIEDPAGTQDDEADVAGGCLFQASQQGEFVGHLYDEHDIAGDPAAFLADYVDVDKMSDVWGAIETDDGMLACPVPEGE